MALDVHTIAVIDGGANFTRTDRIIAAFLPAVANAAGAGAGAAVTVAVTLKNLPANYAVQVTPSQDATWFVTKTATGFTVTLNPRLAANTLASGTIDIVVWA